MLILIFVIALILSIVFGILVELFDNMVCLMTSLISGLAAVITIIVAAFGISTLVSGMSIDEKITICKQENAEIEQDIDAIIEQYIGHESDVFEEAGDINPAVVFTMYPELKSDKMVEKQIDTYVKNNEEIKELKKQKADLKPWRFALYFGQ